MRKIGFFLPVLWIAFAACSPLNKILKSTDYDFKLKKANELYLKKKYSQAVIVYEDIFPVIKGTAPFEDMYWNYANAHFYMRDYLNAENLFKGYLENFPNGTRAEEAHFLRAFCYFKQSPKADLDQTSTLKAMSFLQAYITRFPESSHKKEASDIIDKLRVKLEDKEQRNAQLYYNLGFYKAAATAFNEILFNFPDSQAGDRYKFMVIKSYYEYAKNSIDSKKMERFEQVLDECADFSDRFPDSPLMQDVSKFKNQSENQIKSIKNEQTKETT